MFLPFETAYSVFYVAIPKYEWVPVSPPAQPTDLEAAGAAPAAGLECRPDAMPPPLQLVFKGIEWHAYNVAYQRENGAWQLCAHNRREQDEERAKVSTTEKVKPPAQIGNDPSWGTPQSPADPPAAKLDGERN